MRSFYASYPLWAGLLVGICAAAVAGVVLQHMELFIPSTVVLIGGKSRFWFNTSYKLSGFSKREAYR